jgi:mono/diheme cytochrome c family protein
MSLTITQASFPSTKIETEATQIAGDSGAALLMAGYWKNTALRRLLLFVFALAGTTAWAAAQDAPAAKLKLNTGKEIYQAACVACHGPEGNGMPDTTVAFEKPSTFSDSHDVTRPRRNSTKIGKRPSAMEVPAVGFHASCRPSAKH